MLSSLFAFIMITSILEGTTDGRTPEPTGVKPTTVGPQVKAPWIISCDDQWLWDFGVCGGW